MTPTEFVASVQGGKIEPVYLLMGPETYLQSECLRLLTRQLIPDPEAQQFGYSEHSVAERSLGTVLGIAGQLPMMSSAQVVVAREFDKVSDAEIEALKNYLRRPNPSTVLVFQTTDLDKRRTLSTILLKGCAVVECSRIGDQEAIAWAQAFARKQGYQFSPPAVGQLIGMTGTSLNILSKEIEKLMLYVGKGGTITPVDIEAVVVRSREFSSFDLTDAVLAGDAKKALKLLHRLLGQNEEPVALVGVLAWLYRQMLMAHDMMQNNVPREEIVRDLRMPPGRVTPFLTAVRRKSESDIRRGIIRLAEVDVALKSSRATPRLQLEVLLCDLLAQS